VLNGGSLSEELVGGLLDGVDGKLIIHVEALNNVEASVGGGDWEGEHKTLWHVVVGSRSVSQETNRLPFLASENPVSHVIDGGRSS